MRQIWLLARRDLLQRARSKAFLLAVLLSVGLILSLGPLVALEFRDPPPVVIGLVGEEGPELGAAILASASAAEMDVDIRSYPSLARGEEALRSGESDVLLAGVAGIAGGGEIVWRERESPQVGAVLRAAVESQERAAIASDIGIDPADAVRLLAPPSPVDRTLAPEDPEEVPRIIGANVAVVLLFIAIVMFGQFVLLGVMEEKASRVVEVVLSRARPTQVLAGKVIGIGLLGLVEMLALGGAALLTVSMMSIPGVALPSLGLEVVVSMLVWFVLGYGFYAVVFAALGATISRQEDVQGVSMLPTLLLMPGYFLGLMLYPFSDSVLVRVASIVPLWSPMVMPARMALGAAAWWEVALALALLVLSSVGLVWLAGRVYSGAILRLGRKVKLREAWRAAAS